MSGNNISYNERSWAIDVISQINLYCSQNNISIRRAGGEITLRGNKSLFPDVVLYGDELTGSIIQGWELKMPDTAITDSEFINNATLKAQRLSLNSFLLWNAKEAVLYINKDGTFTIDKSWSIPNIQTRNDVVANETSWKKLLIEILIYLDNLFANNKHKATDFLELSSFFYANTLHKFSKPLASYFQNLSIKDYDFEIELDEWVRENSMQDEHSANKYILLADFTILSWLNRFLFSHYLKTFNHEAEIINSVNLQSTLDDTIQIFDEITKKCDFMNIFVSSITDKHISSDFFEYLIEFNELLKNFWLDKIDTAYFHKVIDFTLSYSRKKIAGQFSTPLNLAYYLASITIKDRTANIIDPCCGSGTISKAIYEIKRKSGIPPHEALDKVWASDKFAYPLQLCSIALSDPMALGCLVKVFKSDVFELKENLKISFIDPYYKELVTKQLPKMHAVVSNLPFVRFESAQIISAEASSYFAENNIAINNKSDLYAYIIPFLKKLVESNGRIGVVVSNSWLATEWGDTFKKVLKKHFKILRIVGSAKGRWFKNADVVSTLLVLENSTTQQDDIVDFITTNTLIDNWDSDTLQDMVKTTLSSKIQSVHITKQSLSLRDIEKISSFGISWNALFSDFSWFLGLSNKLVKASDFMDFARGERRGWDKLFYPETTHKIEKEYIKPVLLNSRNIDSLIATADSEAFCCSVMLDELRNKGHFGAYEWILKFQNATNTTGKPLTEVLARNKHFWYEMKPDTLADMVLSMNPDKKLSIFRLQERSFVNQRLIRLTVKDSHNINLLHALLNNAITMLYIESIGFGRGLGVLDINSKNIAKHLHILNPNMLDDDNIVNIVEKFKPLLKRNILDLPDELKSQDRIEFDKAVLRAFNIDTDISIIYETLLSIYQRRKTVSE